MKTAFSLAVGWLALLGSALVCLAASPAAEETFANTVDGTWTWSFTMPDGSVVRPKLKLSQEGNKLKGSSSFRAGSEMPISEGRIDGDEVSFQVVRERDGQKVVSQYRGILSAGTIIGKVESNWSGEPQSYDWQARRPLLPTETVWRSNVLLPDGQRQQWRMKLKQEEEKLVGKVSPSSRQQLDIKDGKINFGTGELSFAVEREKDGVKTLYQYHGKLSGRSIRGKLDVNLNGKAYSLAWDARRPQFSIEGTWEWSSAGNQDRQLTLRLRGEKLTGKFITDDKHEYDLQKGSFKNGEVYFEVVRDRDGEETLTKFTGKLTEDILTGKIEFIASGETQTTDWEARKAE